MNEISEKGLELALVFSNNQLAEWNISTRLTKETILQLCCGVAAAKLATLLLLDKEKQEPKVDPFIAAMSALGWDDNWSATEMKIMAGQLRAELAKRGVNL